uniref:FERM domain-containing protein n=1 Tax=Macrostomum lignano TaxID=282301 RepID=A0A1I8JPP1_9PLAT
ERKPNLNSISRDVSVISGFSLSAGAAALAGGSWPSSAPPSRFSLMPLQQLSQMPDVPGRQPQWCPTWKVLVSGEIGIARWGHRIRDSATGPVLALIFEAFWTGRAAHPAETCQSGSELPEPSETPAPLRFAQRIGLLLGLLGPAGGSGLIEDSHTARSSPSGRQMTSSVKEQTDNKAFKAYRFVDLTGGDFGLCSSGDPSAAHCSPRILNEWKRQPVFLHFSHFCPSSTVSLMRVAELLLLEEEKSLLRADRSGQEVPDGEDYRLLDERIKHEMGLFPFITTREGTRKCTCPSWSSIELGTAIRHWRSPRPAGTEGVDPNWQQCLPHAGHCPRRYRRHGNLRQRRWRRRRHQPEVDNGYRDVCWDLEQRGAVGETCLHLCFLNATRFTHGCSQEDHRVLSQGGQRHLYLLDVYYGEAFLLDHGANIHQRCLWHLLLAARIQKDQRISYLDDEYLDL